MGQVKPTILSWKEMTIYHVVIQRDKITKANRNKFVKIDGKARRKYPKTMKNDVECNYIFFSFSTAALVWCLNKKHLTVQLKINRELLLLPLLHR